MIKKRMLFVFPESVAINQINEFIPHIHDNQSNYQLPYVDVLIPRKPDIKDFTHSKNVYHGVHSVGQYYSIDQLSFDNATRRGCRIASDNDKKSPYKSIPAIRMDFVEPVYKSILATRTDFVEPVYDYLGYASIRTQIIDKQPDYEYSFALKIDLCGNLIGKAIATQEQDSLSYKPATLNKNSVFHCVQQGAIKFYNCKVVKADFTKLHTAEHFKERARMEAGLTVFGVDSLKSITIKDQSQEDSKFTIDSENTRDNSATPIKTLIREIITVLETNAVISRYTSSPADYQYKLNSTLWSNNSSFIQNLNSAFNRNQEIISFAKRNLFLLIVSNIGAKNITTSVPELSQYFDINTSNIMSQIAQKIQVTNVNSSTLFHEISKIIQLSNLNKNLYPSVETLKNNQSVRDSYNRLSLQGTETYSKTALTAVVNNLLLKGNSLAVVLNADLNILNSLNPQEVLTKLANHFLLNKVQFGGNYIRQVATELTFDLIDNLGYLSYNDKYSFSQGRFLSKFPRVQTLQIIKDTIIKSNACHLENLDEYSGLFLRSVEIDDTVINNIYNENLKKTESIIKKMLDDKKITIKKYFGKTIITTQVLTAIKTEASRMYNNINAVLQDKTLLGIISLADDNKRQLGDFVKIYLYDNEWYTTSKPISDYYSKFLDLYSQRLAEDLLIFENDAKKNSNVILEDKLKSVAMQVINNNQSLMYDKKVIITVDTKKSIARWMAKEILKPNQLATSTAIENLAKSLNNKNFNSFIENFYDTLTDSDSTVQYLKGQYSSWLEISTNTVGYLNKIFIEEKNVPNKPISPTTPSTLFVPNTLGNITQTEAVYGYIEFEIEDGVGLTTQEIDKQMSQIVFSSNLRNIKHFGNLYNNLISQGNSTILKENSNIDFLDDVYIRSNLV